MFNNKIIKNKKIAILAIIFTFNLNIIPINTLSPKAEAVDRIFNWNFYQYTESEPKASPEMDKTLEDAKKANNNDSNSNDSNNNDLNSNNSNMPNDISGPNNPNNLTGAGLDDNSKSGTGAGDYGKNKELVRNILNGQTAEKQIDIKTLGNNYGDTSSDVDANQLAEAQEACLKATSNKDICTNSDVMNKYASCMKEYQTADACAFLLDNTIEKDDSFLSLAKKALQSPEGRENLAKYLGFDSWNDLMLEVGKEVAMTALLTLATGGAGVALRALMLARKGKKALSALEMAEKVATKGSKLEEKLLEKANKININPTEISKMEDIEKGLFKGSKEISTNSEKAIEDIKDIVNKSKELKQEISDIDSGKIVDSVMSKEEMLFRKTDELNKLDSSIEKASRLLEKNDLKNNVVNKTIDAKNFVLEKISNPLTNKVAIGATSAVTSHEICYSDSALANASGINSHEATNHNDAYNQVEANKNAILKAKEDTIKGNIDKISNYRQSVNEAMQVAQANNDEKTIKALDDENVHINNVQNDANAKKTEIIKATQEKYNELTKKQETESRYKRSIASYILNGFK